MYERYCKLRDNLGIKDSILAKDLNITASTFSDWKKGKSSPNADKLLKIARYLNTTVETVYQNNIKSMSDYYSKKMSDHIAGLIKEDA